MKVRKLLELQSNIEERKVPCDLCDDELKPLSLLGARYKTAVIYPYFWPFTVFALLSIFKSFLDLINSNFFITNSL